MGKLSFILPQELAKEKIAFFSLGDHEVQQKWRLVDSTMSLKRLVSLVKYASIIYDRVLHTPSFYIESELSRSLYMHEEILPLFRSQNNLFVLAEKLESYDEHVEKKRQLTPESFSAYHSKDSSRYLRDLRTFDTVYKRKVEIGSIIASLWKEDLAQLDLPGSLNDIIHMIGDPFKEPRYRRVFLSICENRNEYQISPELVKKRLLTEEFPSALIQQVLDKLLVFYVAASAQAINANIIEMVEFVNRDAKQPVLSRYSISLFEMFLDVLGIREKIDLIPISQIITLKKSPEFSKFLLQYFSLVDEAESIERNLRRFHWRIFGERGGKRVIQVNLVLAAASSILLGLVYSYLGLIPNVIYAAYPSISVPLDQVLKRVYHLDQTPFNDFKKRVLTAFELELNKRFYQVNS